MVSTIGEVRSMLTRLVDFLKTRQITAIFTSLTAGSGTLEANEADISSLMDTWVLLKTIEVGGELNRALYVLKSRGMAHSNQIREFLLTDDGLRLLDGYLGPEGVLTGAARVSQEGREKAAGTFRRQRQEAKERELQRTRQIFEARLVTLRGQFELEEQAIQESIAESKLLDQELLQDRGQMVHSREADASAYTPTTKGVAMGGVECRYSQKKPPPSPGSPKLPFVAGHTPKSERAFANLTALCEKHLKGRYQVEVIDLLENPHLARGNQIVAIPTLEVSLPQSVQRIIGDLSNTDRVLVGLSLDRVE
jgi:hypothetical protein